jgi:hypothetical protein
LRSGRALARVHRRSRRLPAFLVLQFYEITIRPPRMGARARARSSGFIRPTYWELPVPQSLNPRLPPDAPAELHFHGSFEESDGGPALGWSPSLQSRPMRKPQLFDEERLAATPAYREEQYAPTMAGAAQPRQHLQRVASLGWTPAQGSIDPAVSSLRRFAAVPPVPVSGRLAPAWDHRWHVRTSPQRLFVCAHSRSGIMGL